MSTEQTAIVSEVGFGNRDVGQPVLWFTVNLDNYGSAALIVKYGQDALDLIKKSDVYDVHDLNDKPCTVIKDGMSVKFVEFWKKP